MYTIPFFIASNFCNFLYKKHVNEVLIALYEILFKPQGLSG